MQKSKFLQKRYLYKNLNISRKRNGILYVQDIVQDVFRWCSSGIWNKLKPEKIYNTILRDTVIIHGR